MDFMSAKEAAAKWGISQRRVALLCAEGRIADANLVGNMWIIPATAQKPEDGRTQRRCSVNTEAKVADKTAVAAETHKTAAHTKSAKSKAITKGKAKSTAKANAAVNSSASLKKSASIKNDTGSTKSSLVTKPHRTATVHNSTMHKPSPLAKPFLKWVGGKGQLLEQIRRYYPFDNPAVYKYAEPFIGGGAVLFDILNRYQLQEVFISDINPVLINTYCVIRDEVDLLIDKLHIMQEEFVPLAETQRRAYYLNCREQFNKLKLDLEHHKIEMAALMIFLNRTGFNGLYRVNKKGYFNVPMGSYKHPKICDANNLQTVSEKLQNVTIICGDYRESSLYIDEHTFVYFDPPYRPLTATSSFTAYSEAIFDDPAQKELAAYVNRLHERGVRMVISNSDPKNTNADDNFFDEVYSGMNITRVGANRMINCKSQARGKINELLISNF